MHIYVYMYICIFMHYIHMCFYVYTEKVKAPLGTVLLLHLGLGVWGLGA